jgi:hypothetical protein
MKGLRYIQHGRHYNKSPLLATCLLMLIPWLKLTEMYRSFSFSSSIHFSSVFHLYFEHQASKGEIKAVANS